MDEDDEEEDEEEQPPGYGTGIKADEYKAIYELQDEIFKKIPRIQADGTFQNPDGGMMSNSEVKTFTRQSIPRRMDGGVWSIATQAEDRARQIKADKAPWTEQEKCKARSMFLISNLKVIPCLYELYWREHLQQDPRFRKGKNGVLLIHHACMSNEFVRPLNVYSYKKKKYNEKTKSSGQRIIHDESSTCVLFSQNYVCENACMSRGAQDRSDRANFSKRSVYGVVGTSSSVHSA